MLKIGLTGSIGSGKTVVAQIFSLLNIPIYFADDEAKKLMHQPNTMTQIKNIFGEEAYTESKLLNKPYISNIIFKDQEKLNQLNRLVHPMVASHFEIWSKKQSKSYIIKEAAILFESEAYKQCDYTILVISNLNDRLHRVKLRDNISEEKFMAINNKQLDDEEKIKRADFVVYNNETQLLIPQILNIHHSLINII